MNVRNQNNFLMTRLPWIVAAVAVIALLATLFWARNRGDAAGSQHDASQDVQARLEALETARQAPGGAARAQGGVGNPGTGSVRNEISDLMNGPQKTPEQMEADRRRELQALEAAFARDKADPVRGGQVERTLEQNVTSETMAGTGLEPDDVAIDCRATTCRVVGQFAKRGDAEDWALFYVTSAGGNVVSQTRMAYVTQPNGATEVRIYATRAGR